MRRNVGLILIGIGVFALVLAPLARFYVAQRLVAAPLNVYQKSTLQADNATYLDTGKLAIVHGATVTATNTTRGDVRASNGDTAVWDSFTSIEDTNTKTSIETQTQRASFDRRNAQLGNTHGAAVGGDTSVKQSGLGMVFPIGTKKKTYPYFDLTTKRTWPMTYEGEEKVQGVDTYRFVQQIPQTDTESVKGGVPASLLGLKKVPVNFAGYDKKAGSVAVDRVYQATVRVWIDPRTGAPINQDQKVQTVLRTQDGTDRLTVADLDLKMNDASQKELAKTSNDQAYKISLVRSWVPVGGLGAGIILLVAGLACFGRGPAAAHEGGTSDSRPSGGEPSDRE